MAKKLGMPRKPSIQLRSVFKKNGATRSRSTASALPRLTVIELNVLTRLRSKVGSDATLSAMPQAENDILLIRCLAARNWEVLPAYKLMRTYCTILVPAMDPEKLEPAEILPQLESEVLALPGTRDVNGAALLVFYGDRFQRTELSAVEMLKLALYLLQHALNNEFNLRNGVTCLFGALQDTRRERQFRSLMEETLLLRYPCKINLFVVATNIWLRSVRMWWGLQFSSTRVKERTRVCCYSRDLRKIIPGPQLPVRLGGEKKDPDPIQWLCAKIGSEMMLMFPTADLEDARTAVAGLKSYDSPDCTSQPHSWRPRSQTLFIPQSKAKPPTDAEEGGARRGMVGVSSLANIVVARRGMVEASSLTNIAVACGVAPAPPARPAETASAAPAAVVEVALARDVQVTTAVAAATVAAVAQTASTDTAVAANTRPPEATPLQSRGPAVVAVPVRTLLGGGMTDPDVDADADTDAMSPAAASAAGAAAPQAAGSVEGPGEQRSSYSADAGGANPVASAAPFVSSSDLRLCASAKAEGVVAESGSAGLTEAEAAEAAAEAVAVVTEPEHEVQGAMAWTDGADVPASPATTPQVGCTGATDAPPMDDSGRLHNISSIHLAAAGPEPGPILG